MIESVYYSKIMLFLFYSAIPVFLTFVLERSFIIFIVKNPKFNRQLADNPWLQPNNISKARSFMGVASVILFHFFNPVFALYFFSFWSITDITDGSLARHLKKTTGLGEEIDPFSDKLLYLPVFIYAGYVLQIINIWLVLIFVIVEIVGQASRRFTAQKAANLFGKAKTLNAIFTLMVVYSNYVYFSTLPFKFSNGLLIGTIFLGLCSIVFRVIPNYWYANILSILNMLCGLTSILIVFLGYPYVFAFLLIFLGQVLDQFDGRAAEKWGSTPRGEVFDDIADATSFGVAISVVIFSSLGFSLLGLGLAIFHSTATIYRLVRFINDKKVAGTSGGVSVFNGLPSPAGALFVGSFILLWQYSCQEFVCYKPLWVQSFVVILTGLLMVSHIPYIHAGRRLSPKIPKKLKVLLYSVFIMLVVISVRLDSYQMILSLIFSCACIYLIFGIEYSSIFKGRKSISGQNTK